MRRLIAVLIVAMVALTLVGCGGGDEPAATDDTVTPPAAPPAAPVVEEDPDLNDPVTGFPRELGEVIPAQVQQALDSEQPVMILFYDSQQGIADDIRGEVDAVAEEYRGLIDLVEYGIDDDMEDVLSGGAFSEDLSEEEQADRRRVYMLADDLRVGATPFIALIDREGTVTWMYRGYVDRDSLELEVLYATQ